MDNFFICQEISMHNWIPQPRESGSLMQRPGDTALYLFGGICQEPMTAMATFDLSYNMNNGRYRQLEMSTQTGLEKVKGTFGLGSCTYNGKLYYLFGG